MAFLQQECEEPPAQNVCNGKGFWVVLQCLLMLAAGGSIVAGGNVFLRGGLLLLLGTYCLWKGCIFAGGRSIARDSLLLMGLVLNWSIAPRGIYCCWGGLLLLAAGDLFYYLIPQMLLGSVYTKRGSTGRWVGQGTVLGGR